MGSGGKRPRARSTMVGEALLAHKFRVMRLYRHHLKNMMSWEIHREAKIFEQFEAIRAEFEKNRNVPTIAEAKQLVKPGKSTLTRSSTRTPTSFRTTSAAPCTPATRPTPRRSNSITTLAGRATMACRGDDGVVAEHLTLRICF